MALTINAAARRDDDDKTWKPDLQLQYVTAKAATLTLLAPEAVDRIDIRILMETYATSPFNIPFIIAENNVIPLRGQRLILLTAYTELAKPESMYLRKRWLHIWPSFLSLPPQPAGIGPRYGLSKHADSLRLLSSQSI